MRSLEMSLAAVLSGILAVAGCQSSTSLTGSGDDMPADVRQEQVERRHQEWSDAIVYFVVLDRFADGDRTNNVAVDESEPGHFHGGDLAGLTANLDEIADLGVTAVWITPVVKNIDHFVTGAGFPDYGYHGYWADDFYRLDERFGTEAELEALVDAAHARGIAVLLDVVYNHCGYEASYVEDPRFQPWLRVYGECGDDALTTCVGGLPDWRTERPEVADWLLEAHLGLAERVGLDGFRLDTVKHVDHPFWQEHRRRSRARLGDGFFLLGEVWGGDPDVLDPYFAGDEMDAGFDFTFSGSVLSWLEGRGRTVAFSRYLERRHRTRDGYHLAHYLSSHDVETAPSVLDGDWARYRVAVALQMTTVGLPVMYYGEEVGRYGGEWPDNRSDHPWGNRPIEPGDGLERDEGLRDWVGRWVGIRRQHPALSRGSYRGLATDGDLLVFERFDEGTGDRVIVAANRGDSPARATVPAPEPWRGLEVYDVLSDSHIESNDGGLVVEVGPMTATVIGAR